MKKSLESIGKTVAINLFVLGCMCLVLELILHLVFSNVNHPKVLKFASYDQMTQNQGLPIYTPHRYLGYIPTPDYKKGENKHNALGFRGEAFSSEHSDKPFRIVCLGGSTTYTVKVEDYKHSYPYQLQEELKTRTDKNIEVINAGAGAWTSWESSINLQIRLLNLKPDLVVIYHAINDVHARMVWPPEQYRSDNSGWRIAKANTPLYTGQWKAWLLERSNILRIIAISLGKKAPAKSFQHFDDCADSFYMYEFHQQFLAGTYPSGLFEEVPAQQMLERNPPIYFQQNMEAMITLAKARQVPVMLATFKYSDEFSDYLTSTPEYQFALAQHNSIIKELGRIHTIPILDFEQLFPDDKKLYADAIHVNKDGSQKKAAIFARFIVENFMPDAVLQSE